MTTKCVFNATSYICKCPSKVLQMFTCKNSAYDKTISKLYTHKALWLAAAPYQVSKVAKPNPPWHTV